MEPKAVILAMLVTIPFTACICRLRLSQNKSISYGTMFAGACIASLVFVVSCLVYSNGWQVLADRDLLTAENKAFGRGAVPKFTLYLALICVLPALIVVLYYQRQRLKQR